MSCLPTDKFLKDENVASVNNTFSCLVTASNLNEAQVFTCPEDFLVPAPSFPLENFYCRICGDVAMGYHYGVLACMSCKMFFRRTACSENPPTCKYMNECQITLLTRKKCAACRLQKCYHLGMAYKKCRRLRRSSKALMSDFGSAALLNAVNHLSLETKNLTKALCESLNSLQAQTNVLIHLFKQTLDQLKEFDDFISGP